MDKGKLKTWLKILEDLKMTAVRASGAKENLNAAFSVHLIHAIEKIVEALTEEGK